MAGSKTATVLFSPGRALKGHCLQIESQNGKLTESGRRARIRFRKRISKKDYSALENPEPSKGALFFL